MPFYEKSVVDFQAAKNIRVTFWFFEEQTNVFHACILEGFFSPFEQTAKHIIQILLKKELKKKIKGERLMKKVNKSVHEEHFFKLYVREPEAWVNLT